MFVAIAWTSTGLCEWLFRKFQVMLRRFLRQKEECEKSGPCDMGGFTRVLHSGYADDLMDEIPTFIAKELPDHYKKNGGTG